MLLGKHGTDPEKGSQPETPSVSKPSASPAIPHLISSDLKSCLVSVGQIVLDHIRANLRAFNKNDQKGTIESLLSKVFTCIFMII
jgi:hypothetical protein